MVEVVGLGVYFNCPPGMKFSDPIKAWQQLLLIFGIRRRSYSRDGIEFNNMIPGWVLRKLDLNIRRGEIVFLAGSSGAGKSVLLRVLSGAIPPSEGVVRLTGKVSSLLSIGDNLDVRLSAIENIRLFQRFFGVPKSDTATFVHEVITFAGLNGFEDVPVRTYSTGMVMRLSIALVMQDSPDILLIDDVLGVGDIEFRQRCIERLHEMKESGCTMLMVCDDEILERQLATRVVTLSAGKLVVDEIPRVWFSPQHEIGTRTLKWQVHNQLPFNDVMALKAVRVLEAGEAPAMILRVEMDYLAEIAGLTCRPLVDVMCGKVLLWRSLYPKRQEISAPGLLKYWVDLPITYLKQGTYKLTLGMVIVNGDLIYSLKAHDLVTLDVLFDRNADSSLHSMLNIPCQWEVGKIPTNAITREIHD
jgi:ABC-type polysaccharide/polyol phosphate transport system ATPase subunit